MGNNVLTENDLSPKLIKYLLVKRGFSFFKNKLYEDKKYYIETEKEINAMSEEEKKEYYKEVLITSHSYEAVEEELIEYRNNNIEKFTKYNKVPTVYSCISEDLWDKYMQENGNEWTSEDYLNGYKYCQYVIDSEDWSDIMTDIYYKIKPEFEEEWKEFKDSVYKKYGLIGSESDLKKKYMHKEVIKSKRLQLPRKKITEEPEVFKNLSLCLISLDYQAEEE